MCDTKSFAERQKICDYYKNEEEFLEKHNNLKRNAPNPVELDKHTNLTTEVSSPESKVQVLVQDQDELKKQTNLTKEVDSPVDLEKHSNLTTEMPSPVSNVEVIITVNDGPEQQTNFAEAAIFNHTIKNPVVLGQPKPSHLKKYGWSKFEHLEPNIKKVCPWMADQH